MVGGDGALALGTAEGRAVATVLRGYQFSGLELTRAAWKAGHRRIVLVMPTGSGKTSTACALIDGATRKGRRVVVVIHRIEIIAQFCTRLAALGIRHGVIAASDSTDADALVQVCSVATLAARMGNLPPAELVVIDEAHHVVAATWLEVARSYASATVLLLTATPERADGVGLRAYADAMVQPVTIGELIAQGFLVECDVIAPAKMLAKGLAQDPVEAVVEHAAWKPAVVFCATVAEAKDVAARLVARGIRAACVDGAMVGAERAAILARFASGDVQVITNAQILTEGWDCPSAAVCVLARGCGSLSLFLQMVGRVLRPAPGKDRALLVDLRGVVHRWGLPTDERTWTLDGADAKAAAEALPPLRTCAECGACFRAKPVCPRCGFRSPARAQEIHREKLSSVVTTASEAERLAEWNALREIQRRRGYKPLWCAVRFKETYGFWPPRHYPRACEVAA